MSTYSFARDAMSGKSVRQAKKLRKSLKASGANDATMKAASKSVRKSKAESTYVRGTAAAGAGGAYIATKDKKDDDSFIPKDY